MSSPTVVPLATQSTLPTEPFVTVAEFKAHPTYLDVQSLRPASPLIADQDAVLRNILLEASEAAENYCNQPLGAHVQTDYGRNFIDRRGRLKFYAEHGPVRTVLSWSYASALGQVTSATNPLWQPDGNHQVIVEVAGSNTTWSGSLQFAAPPSSVELYTTLTYVAAYANATLTAPVNAADTTINVTNPTGIYAGDVLRLWDPGAEESVTIAPSWLGQATSPYTAAAIPLVSPLQHPHAAGVGVSGLGADLHLAITYLAVDALQRWGSSGNTFPGARVKASLGKDKNAMSAWQRKACDLLESYRAVR